jgi:formate hydrogenlyase subunit 3/multisubunit Na+/H+ antiporter MnhD subunit
MEEVGDEKAVVVVIKECFVIKAVLTLLLLLLLFFFLSFSLSLFFFLYFLARKKKERANKKNYFSCIRLMNFFINMQAVACHAFISREWLAGRKSERERERKEKWW